MFNLNLPQLPDTIINSIIEQEWYKIIPENNPLSGGAEINKFELLLADYQVKIYDESSDVNKYINKMYSSLFDDVLVTAVLTWTNRTLGTTQAAPHCDKMRTIGINFLIANGGDDVTTTIYKEQRITEDLAHAEYMYHKELHADSIFKVPNRTWYVFDNQQYHSIESIKSTRILLAVIPKNKTYSQTMKNISKLITPLPKEPHAHFNIRNKQ